MSKQFYTVKDLVSIGLCSQAQAYNLMHSKGFPSIRVGKGALRVKIADFEQWLENQRVNNR